MRKEFAQRLRRFAAVLGLTLALVLVLFSSVMAQNVVQPIDQDSCGLIVAQVFPPLDGPQTVTQGVANARTTGALLAKGNDMTVTLQGPSVLIKQSSEFGRMWTTPISQTGSVTMTTASGPDKNWVTYAGGTDFYPFRRLVVSMGNPITDGGYEKVVLHYKAYSDQVSGCILGAYNQAEDGLSISVIVRVGGQEKSHQSFEKSTLAGTVDLISFTVPSKVNDSIEIEIRNSESASQARTRYFVAGLVVKGASQHGQVIDSDNDGIPDDEDNAPGRNNCAVTVASSVGPHVVNAPMDIDLSAVGDCGGVVSLKHMVANFIKNTESDGTYVLVPGVDCMRWYQDYTVCRLDNGHNHFRITISPLRAGRSYGYANIGFVEEAFKYWSGFWDVLGTNIFITTAFR